MADTSPGKVQALRAMFAQKNDPVMGCIQPGTKANRPWSNRSSASLSEDGNSDEKQTISAVSVTATQAILRAIQTNDRTKQSHSLCDTSSIKNLKPSIGPKPFISAQQRTISSNAFKSSINSSVHKRTYISSAPCNSSKNSHGINRTDVGDTVASFMFGESNRVPGLRADDNSSDNSRYTPPPTSKPTINGAPLSGDSMKPKNPSNVSPVNSHVSLINADNYICKSSSNFRRKELPSKEKLGPPPAKPVKPYHLKLPEKFLAKSHSIISNGEASHENKPILPPKRSEVGSPSVPQKPPYPCPPRPSTSPPIPPSTSPPVPPSDKPCNNKPQIIKQKSLLEEIEQLYEDTLSRDSSIMIPEYTEAEEEEDLYDDAGPENYSPNGRQTCHQKPNYPPLQSSSRQSLYLEPNVNGGIPEEIYHDTDEPEDGEVYEIMPVEDMLEDPYSNNAKEIEKLKKEEEKRIRKENKARLKKEKEADKLKKKFGLTGDETYIDSGLVKADYRGGRLDLPVKKGEIVNILRIEGNPVGKWLVKNKKGKYGYVELTNIEVDPDSVKSVMSVRKASVISTNYSEELYNEAYSEQEGIYELTY